MINIQAIAEDQAGQLAVLQTRTFREAYADVHASTDLDAYCRTHYTKEKAVAEVTASDAVCRFGMLADQPSGYYIVRHRVSRLAPAPLSSELKQIYVLRSAYGSGLGQALYQDALEAIRSVGHRLVWLCVSDINDRAKSFYEKLGFERVAAGPALSVGKDQLPSSILTREL